MNGFNPYMNMPIHSQMMVPSYGAMDQQDYKKHMQDQCKNYMLQYVVIEMNDGSSYDGIVEDMDDDHVIILIPEGDQDWGHHRETEQNEEERQFGYGGFPGYGGGYGYGYGVPWRFRRFRRYRFPFFGVRRFFFPFFY
ncbi:MAG: hypothetical protein H0Z32_03920 [Bacillaceae bacterium]|nr:hypothetical protein [Bacillaceae bacterium]